MTRVFTVSLDQTCIQPLKKILNGSAVELFDKRIDEIGEIDPAFLPSIVVCGEPDSGQSILEFAQYLSLCFPDARVIYASSCKATYNRTLLEKNGFKEAFLLPFETAEFEKCLDGMVAAVKGVSQKKFRAVKLVDLMGEDPLEFDTYLFLPMNCRYFKLTKSGQRLRPEQIQKLKAHECGFIHIRLEDMPLFYQFTAQQLLMLGKSDTVSETERQEKMQNAVRNIVSGVFANTDGKGVAFDDGRALINDCKQIVKSFIGANAGKQADLFQKLAEMGQSEGSPYASASNVVTFASLFSIALKVGNSEEVALAGMLRDIGLADLPPDIQVKSRVELTPEEDTIYKKHSEYSVRMLMEKRLTLSKKVADIILQHHENFDGSGFPHGISGSKILLEAQLIAIADSFDELLKVKKGKPRLTPRQAMKAIVDPQSTEFGRRFDSALLARIAKLVL